MCRSLTIVGKVNWIGEVGCAEGGFRYVDGWLGGLGGQEDG